VNRAEQILNRLEAIETALAANPPEVDPVNVDELLAWLMKSMPASSREALIEEWRLLRREYDLLPSHLKSSGQGSPRRKTAR
jgi:hypothetical protein